MSSRVLEHLSFLFEICGQGFNVNSVFFVNLVVFEILQRSSFLSFTRILLHLHLYPCVIMSHAAGADAAVEEVDSQEVASPGPCDQPSCG